MILLINKEDAKSRAFYAKHRNEFDEILAYPDCLDRYKELSSFPAIVVDIPEYTRDNSLWFNIKNLPNYKRLGMTAGECVRHNEAIKATCGASNGGHILDQYIKEKGLKDESNHWLVQIANSTLMPSFMTWFTVISKWVYDLGEECKEEIDEMNKERSISYDPNVPILEVVPASQKILYVETIDEAKAEIKKYQDRIDKRNDIYKGK